MTYAERECFDCGRLVRRDQMQRHSDRRHSGTSYTQGDTWPRKGREHFSNREVLVCATCGGRRSAWGLVKLAAIVIGILLIFVIGFKGQNIFGGRAPAEKVFESGSPQKETREIPREDIPPETAPPPAAQSQSTAPEDGPSPPAEEPSDAPQPDQALPPEIPY